MAASIGTPTTYTARPCADLRSEHAEGPAWDAARAELVWVDIPAGRVHRGRLRDGGEPYLDIVAPHEVGQCVSAVVPHVDRERGWIVASEHGFAQLRTDGSLRVLGEPEAGRPGRTRMNDGKCDPSGRLWAGSMALDVASGGGRLYRLDLDGVVDLVLPAVTVSNGLAWTADGQTMYYIDTPTRRVDRLDLDPATGAVLARRAAFEVDAGSPDGMTIDDDGCLWIAAWGAAAVVRYGVDGEVLARVEVDAEQVSSCAFGGPERRTLFITTSQEGLTPAERKRQPNAGRVFCAEVDVSGPAAAPCRVRVEPPAKADQPAAPTTRSVEEETVP